VNRHDLSSGFGFNSIDIQENKKAQTFASFEGGPNGRAADAPVSALFCGGRQLSSEKEINGKR